jgi:hypothetical protein
LIVLCSISDKSSGGTYQAEQWNFKTAQPFFEICQPQVAQSLTEQKLPGTRAKNFTEYKYGTSVCTVRTITRLHWALKPSQAACFLLWMRLNKSPPSIISYLS